MKKLFHYTKNKEEDKISKPMQKSSKKETKKLYKKESSNKTQGSRKKPLKR